MGRQTRQRQAEPWGEEVTNWQSAKIRTLAKRVDALESHQPLRAIISELEEKMELIIRGLSLAMDLKLEENRWVPLQVEREERAQMVRDVVRLDLEEILEYEVDYFGKEASASDSARLPDCTPTYNKGNADYDDIDVETHACSDDFNLADDNEGALRNLNGLDDNFDDDATEGNDTNIWMTRDATDNGASAVGVWDGPTAATDCKGGNADDECVKPERKEEDTCNEHYRGDNDSKDGKDFGANIVDFRHFDFITGTFTTTITDSHTNDDTGCVISYAQVKQLSEQVNEREAMWQKCVEQSQAQVIQLAEKTHNISEAVSRSDERIDRWHAQVTQLIEENQSLRNELSIIRGRAPEPRSNDRADPENLEDTSEHALLTDKVWSTTSAAQQTSEAMTRCKKKKATQASRRQQRKEKEEKNTLAGSLANDAAMNSQGEERKEKERAILAGADTLATSSQYDKQEAIPIGATDDREDRSPSPSACMERAVHQFPCEVHSSLCKEEDICAHAQ